MQLYFNNNKNDDNNNNNNNNKITENFLDILYTTVLYVTANSA